ncbi:histidine kinase [Clostridia bacterium]|nr:histidine kinase [Clostridia bacterium]
MQELSLDILDIVQNSVRANAALIELSVTVDEPADLLTVYVKDDGCGMSASQLAKVTDPFWTTRTTRKGNIGLGIPLFKMGAELTGGSLTVTSDDSADSHGTELTATFGLRSIDRPPLGDICDTVHMLVTLNTRIDFVYTYRVVSGGDARGFTLDTREFKETLGGVPLDTPDVAQYIAEYLTENTLESNAGRSY